MDALLKFYIRQCYRPGIIGLLINPFYFVRVSIYNAIKKHAREINGTVLDFGCGGKPYEHLFRAERYIGLDVEQTGHDHAANKEVVDVYYDGKDIPFAPQYFDSCFSSQVFEHIFDLDHSLKEIHRVLKPNGTCLFLAPFVWEEHETPYDFARYASFGFRHVLKKNGFQIIKHEKDSHFARVIAQLWCSYIHDILPTKKVKYVNVVLSITFVFPFTVIGWLLQAIAPRNYDLYFNNVIIAKKISA